jgi:hypothetical protein
MLRRDGIVHLPGSVAHLWPFARAFVATLDLAGIPDAVAGGSAGGGTAVGKAAAVPVIAHRLAALERYWDERGPAYASDPPGTRTGGDIYYDDNAWVGLALVQLELLAPGTAPLQRAAAIVRFARAGWDGEVGVPHPGGVFWVQQGRGVGLRNHDRNAVSTAPNAQLIVHLEALGHPDVDPGAQPAAAAMGAWVERTLDAGGDGCGPFWDKLRGDGTIDRATWSYNQGSMLGLYALLSDRDAGDAPSHLRRAESIARAALDHYSSRRYDGEPVEFVAIFMRNLLQLSARTADEPLRHRIAQALGERAEAAWPISATATLLEHSAAVTLQALAAWDPSTYRLLA